MRRNLSNNPSKSVDQPEPFDVAKGFGTLFAKLEMMQNDILKQSTEIALIQKGLGRVTEKVRQDKNHVDINHVASSPNDSPGTDREQTPEEAALDSTWINDPLKEPYATNILNVDAMNQIAEECGADFIKDLRH